MTSYSKRTGPEPSAGTSDVIVDGNVNLFDSESASMKKPPKGGFFIEQEIGESRK